MAQPDSHFISDDQIPSAVQEIIRTAKEYVVLACPYNDFWGQLRNEIHRARRRKVRVTFIHRPIRDGDYNPGKAREDVTWLRNEGATVHVVERLHAKFYFNESMVLLTSMNLLALAMRNSLDVGVWLSEPEADDLRQYAKRLIEDAEDSAEGRDLPSPPPNDRTQSPSGEHRSPAYASDSSQPSREAREEQDGFRIDKDALLRLPDRAREEAGRVLGRVRGEFDKWRRR